MPSNFERESDSGSGSGGQVDYSQALLALSELVVDHRSLPELTVAIAERLGEVAAAELAHLALHDPTRNVMRLHVVQGQESIPAPIDVPVMDSLEGLAWQTQQLLLVPDVDAEGRFQPVVTLLKDKGIRSFCALPLTTAKKQLGALGLGSSGVGAYSERELRLLRRLAPMVAVVVENTLTREALLHDKARLKMLLQVTASLIANPDVEESFPAISGLMRRMIGHDYVSVAVYDEATLSVSLYRLDSSLTKGLVGGDTVFAVKETPVGVALLERKTRIFTREELVRMQSSFVSHLLAQPIQSLCCIPLVTRKGVLGTLNLGSNQDNAFIGQDFDFLNQVAAQIAIALDNIRAYREIAELNDQLAKEKLYLEDEVRAEFNFSEIVGESAALRQVLGQARTVAPSDATVLILGETGTGKELIARAIHRMSSRKDGRFIKLNCAAIPTGLLESELFGHEKGAFTGAVSQKVGRLELADKGTLFLDEVGDLPLELQPKLLRVLQDQEFERLGSTHTIRVNIRLITATNRDLPELIAARMFRSDLFYRINVFPIRMPALRERQDDIPLLVRYFVQKHARRMNKPIETIPTKTMNALVTWGWPGNVRELENFIERSVILSEDSVLRAPLAELVLPSEDNQQEGTLERLGRAHIVRVLRETRGRLAGPRGAAVRLGLKRTTLQSMILRLGISREEYEK